MGFAKVSHQPRAPHTQAGLERARFVVDARMNHARVAARLVPRDPRLLFDEREFEVRVTLRKLERRRQPHDAAANHGEVIGCHGAAQLTSVTFFCSTAFCSTAFCSTAFCSTAFCCLMTFTIAWKLTATPRARGRDCYNDVLRDKAIIWGFGNAELLLIRVSYVVSSKTRPNKDLAVQGKTHRNGSDGVDLKF